MPILSFASPYDVTDREPLLVSTPLNLFQIREPNASRPSSPDTLGEGPYIWTTLNIALRPAGVTLLWPRESIRFA
jgi:hypothetical protein